MRANRVRRRALAGAALVLLFSAPVLFEVGSGASGAAGNLGASQHVVAQRAAIDIADEGVDLLALGGLSTSFAPLPQALDPLGLHVPSGTSALLAALRTANSDGQAELRALMSLTSNVSPPITAILSPLSSANLSAAAAHHSISIQPQQFIGALSDLTTRDGTTPTSQGGTPPDPNTVSRLLRADIATYGDGPLRPTGTPTTTTRPQHSTTTGGVPPQTTAPSGAPVGTKKSNSTVLLIVALLGAIVVIGGLVLALLRRRKPGSRPAVAAAPGGWAVTSGGGVSAGPAGVAAPVGPASGIGGPQSGPEAAAIHELLDVSRRLAAITAVPDIHRAIVREAMGLVHARSAALVVREGDSLHIAYETDADSFRADRLAEGAIGRVAETGQPATQVSASEPSIRNLPAALVAVPLVAKGTVAAVLAMLREPENPFAAWERNILVSLAPVAAAAMYSSEVATAAMEESLVDPLTGIGNRRRLDEELPRTLREAGGGPTSVVMVDIDHFKSVNDEHGHQAGDAVLKAVAAIVRDSIRPGDGVYRYGGEEFCVIMPSTPLPEAAEAAERVRAAVEARAFDVGGGEIRRTASFGVACTTSSDSAALVAAADAALYEAKNGGRNKVVSAP
ncbi:MAG TPA: diguanylate cyclase [Acidimicrobiales bacterium]|nr:diguanylate cyclase [Acidimicrobiales bacterium]